MRVPFHTKLQMNKWTLNLQRCNGIKRMKSDICLLHEGAPPISCQQRLSCSWSSSNKSSHSFIMHFPALSADVLVYLLSLGHFQSYQVETGTKSCTSPHSAFIPALATSCLVPVFTSQRHAVHNTQSLSKTIQALLRMVQSIHCLQIKTGWFNLWFDTLE